MNLYSIAIGKQYEIEAKRLQDSMKPLGVKVFTSKDVERKHEDNLINGLYHKTNFANYIKDANGAVVFMDADMFTLSDNPFKDFKVKDNTDFAFVPYDGNWHFPDTTRQKAFDYFGYKINSGFMYFRTLKIAKEICTLWSKAYLERVKIYDIEPNQSKNEYDEYALMIALMGSKYKFELLDGKWNDWHLETKEEILNSDSVFFQSHNYLDIKAKI